MKDKNRYNELVFAIENYQWNKTQEEARVDMWKDISEFLQILFKQEMTAIIYDDDIDIIVVQYNYKNPEYNEYFPCWITDDEYWRGVSEEEKPAPSNYLCGKKDRDEINF